MTGTGGEICVDSPLSQYVDHQSDSTYKIGVIGIDRPSPFNRLLNELFGGNLSN